MQVREITFDAARPVAAPELDLKPAISVVGLGYVGAVSTACLAGLGHRVTGVDLDAAKTEAIARGSSPIHEAGLGDALSEGVAAGLISATSDLVQAVAETDVTFVSVGTPTAADGGCDTSCIRAAAESMGRGLKQKDGFHVFVMRCSIPPGTTRGVMVPVIEEVSGKVAGRDFGVCFNPEFLREGVAIADFHAPPKTVVGASDPRSAAILRRIYEPVDAHVITTTIEAAEMVKYTDNVWHAAKVCFANEIGRLCKSLEIDSHAVMEIFVQDEKLNLSSYYLKPGFAYGGSCLPKEVRAVTHMAAEQGVSLPMIGGLDRSNKEQIRTAVELVRQSGARRVGVLGLAFKPGTDDLRESPVLEVMAALMEEGIEICAHDEAVTPETSIASQLAYVSHASPGLARLSQHLPGMMSPSAGQVLENSDLLLVSHRTDGYRKLVAANPGVQVVDLVRLFDRLPAGEGYEGIGW
jgi:GDP-mannose 6-dehydrogenase